MTETTTTAAMKTRTGLVSPKCFAGPLADCDGGAATREHYISRNLLLRFGDEVWVEGLSWMDVARQLTERTMVSNMLCLKHNNGLSNLDSMIGRFYDVIASSHAGRDSGWHSFEGELLERWALKLMCGLLASGNYGNARGGEGPVRG